MKPIVVVRAGNESAESEVWQAAQWAHQRSEHARLEVIRVLEAQYLPSTAVGRISRIGAERWALDEEVDRISRYFPLLHVSSRVLVDDPGALLRRLDRLGWDVVTCGMPAGEQLRAG